MEPSVTSGNQDQLFLQRLNEVMQRIAHHGDLHAVEPLMAMTGQLPPQSTLAQLAESFAHMVVKLEAREFELECRIEDLNQTRHELEQANLDPLTNLPNRMIARDRLRQAIAEARNRQVAFTVFFLDLDRFKRVNDTLGHAAGDQLLIAAAARMRQALRASDLLARQGGDEFMILLHDIHSMEEALGVAEKIRLATNQPFMLDGTERLVSVSIGIALYPEHGEDIETLTRNADAAMYRTKTTGRNGASAAPDTASPLD